MPKCKNCVEILKKEGTKGMKIRGYRPKSTRIKMRKNYPFGRRSKGITTAVHCKNCGGTEFI